MAIKLSTHRCSDCQGVLEFNKVEKRFECPYCGKIYEKDLNFNKVQIDGLAGINETVRTTLLNISNLEFAKAAENLSECEKLDHNFVGTTIANVAYNFFRGAFDKTFDKNVANGKIAFYIKELNDEYQLVDDDEKQLYDFMESPELYAVLYIVYLSTSQKSRAEYIANFLDFDKILNPNLNKTMLSILLKTQTYNEVDNIVKNINFIDKRYTLYEILKSYPSNDKKYELVKFLIEKNSFSYKEEALIKKYLDETKDSLDIKFLVVAEAINLKIDVELGDLLRDVFSHKGNTPIDKIFEMLSKIKLSYKDLSLILKYCFSAECSNTEVILSGLKCLNEGGSVIELSSNELLMLIKESQISIEDKIEVLRYCIENFRLTNRALDDLFEYTLIKFTGSVEERFNLNMFLLDNIKSIPIETLTNYFVLKNKDGDQKIKVVEKILSLNMNKAYFNSFLSKYIISVNDEGNVKITILKLLIKKYGLTIDAKSFDHLLSIGALNEELINLIFAQNVSISDNAVNIYLRNVKPEKYDAYLMTKLLGFSQKINGMSLKIYLLRIKDIEVRKADIALKLIRSCVDNITDEFTFNFMSNSVIGNITQTYLLTSTDAKSDIFKVTQELSKKYKLSDNMIVNGKKIAFKKFIVSLKDKLDNDINELCTELGVFKFFF